MFKKKVTYILLVFLFSLPLTMFAQVRESSKRPDKTITRILFVFDASQSMYGRWQSDIKINIAQKIMSKVLDSLKSYENLELALRVYGHQKHYPPQDCEDTRLEVPFGKNNFEMIKHRLNALTPKGTTPIAYSLQKAGHDFPPCDNCRNIIILITDGIEECGGDPCEVSKELQKQGIILKPFVIGIGRNFRDAFDCVGTYFEASSEKQFSKALNVVISQALNSTTAQVNLLDSYDKPTETNVNMTFYDNFSGLVKYNFIHTMNSKGLPDTLVIDQLITYDVVVHTLPPVKIDSIRLEPGKHTTIPLSAPQGHLRLKIDGYASSPRSLQCIIREKGSMETVNVQMFGHTEKYLTGLYDLEVLCLPRIYITDVDILQSSTTTVEIPVPGIAVIHKSTMGYGSLYVVRGDRMEWVYNFRENTTQQETIILQPGKYRVVFRAKYSDRSIYTMEESFRVYSGRTTNVKIYN